MERCVERCGENTYAGIVRLVTAAQTAKSPFIRLADRYALLLLPVTLTVADGAWLLTGDPIRGLAPLTHPPVGRKSMTHRFLGGEGNR